MDIVDVTGYALSSPIEPVQERRFHGGTRRLLKRDVVLVCVETADGTAGFAPSGASSSAMREYFDGQSQGTFADLVNDTVANRLEGASLDAIEDAHDLLRGAGLPRHLYSQAASAVDVALHDIRGKRTGAPVYDLLADRYGTDPTTELPLYASAGMYMAPEGYVEQAALLEDAGFAGYKYRPGIGPDEDRETVERLAEAVGTDLMVDAHTWWKIREGYDRRTVASLVAHAGEHGAFWVEEPVEPDDRDGYVALSDRGVPLAGGESEPDADGLVGLGRTGGVAYLQGDVRHHGGYTGCREAVEFCRGSPVEFVPHHFGTWLGLLANAHLVAAAPGAELLEYPVFENDPTLDCPGEPGMYPFELAFDILRGTPDVESGVLTLPDAPGLGIDIDRSVLGTYPFVDGPWTEFHYHE